MAPLICVCSMSTFVLQLPSCYVILREIGPNAASKLAMQLDDAI